MAHISSQALSSVRPDPRETTMFPSKSSFIFAVFCLTIVQSKRPKSSKDCKELLEGVDEGLRHLLMMDEGALIPGNKTQLDQYCKIVSPVGKLAQQYLKCETGLRKQLVSVFTSAVKKPINFLCKKQREETIKNFACFNQEFSSGVVQNMAFLSHNYKLLSEKTSLDDIVPTFCCSTSLYLDRLKKLKAPKCDSPRVNPRNFYFDRVSSAMNDLLDLLCGSHKSVGQCEEKSPELMKELVSQSTKSFKDGKVPLTGYILTAFGKIA